ncbi:MAG: hypothetical protein A2542_01990 [Parcubacteria group bacterium RIFOXYD2_FULL_52_8]|nr:MAG: hypothetical protein A2542_01990 [Parcubacteria group bacterium RIFOXYD2_FULL_52_8]
MKRIAPHKIQELQRKVFDWYALHKRDLPWRRTKDPYLILLSEVMLQQTQVSRVVPKYLAFIKKFPTVGALARGRKATILRLWSGLGYNSRALRLRELAKIVVRDHAGRFPTSEEALGALPGIGPYTLRAVQIFAWNRNVAAIDTNIRRILIREFKVASSASERDLQALALSCLPRGKSRVWHNALMDYGALLITSRVTRIRPLTRRSRFKDSRRYYRGQIVKSLLAQKTTSLDALRAAYPAASHDLATIVAALVREGVLREQNGLLQI